MQTNQKGIISLIVILSVGFFALSAALTIAISSFAGLMDNRNIKFGDFAFYASEAAAKEGVLQFRESIDYAGGSLDEINGSSGDISVTELEWPYVEITGLSDNTFSSRDNVLKVTLFAEGLAFNYAVFSETELYINGTFDVKEGNIFANGSITVKGDSIVDGDAFSSSEEISGVDHITGDIFENVEPIPGPVINIDDYINPPLDGVFYFDNPGEAKSFIQSMDGEFVGCLIVEGDLKITGNDFTRKEGDPMMPVMIINGNLDIAGDATIKGLVYVTGETRIYGTKNTIYGSLLSLGGVSGGGTATIYFEPDYVPDILDIYDPENTTSSVKPRIIDWHQE